MFNTGDFVEAGICLPVGAAAGGWAMRRWICRAWTASIGRGFRLLTRVSAERPLQGPDIQLAFDPELWRDRDEALGMMERTP